MRRNAGEHRRHGGALDRSVRETHAQLSRIPTCKRFLLQSPAQSVDRSADGERAATALARDLLLDAGGPMAVVPRPGACDAGRFHSGPVPAGNSRSDISMVEPTQDGHGHRLTDGLNILGSCLVFYRR